MSDIAIKVENLSKKYLIGTAQQRHDTLRDLVVDRARNIFRRDQSDETILWSLKDVSFDVRPGEVVGIIGRNGAGKSTLLKILSRITEPTTGRAELNGRVGSLLEVGTGFHPELTGRENIYLNGAILGMRRVEIDRKFDEIVAFSEIGKFLDTPVKRYSSGMYVRLAFAVAAHLETEILLVDEVLAVGDAEFQRKCIGKMDEVSSRGRTILYVSHNLASVQALCHRTIWLSGGTLAMDASTPDVISSYLDKTDLLADVNVAQRQDRVGEGEVKLIGVHISNYESPPSELLVTGKPARFVFRVAGDLSNVSCAFTIYDHMGQAVAAFDSAILAPRDVVGSSIEKDFICDLDALTIIPGHYWINTALRKNDELQDHVVSAARFEVETGYLSGRQFKREYLGCILLDHKWIIPHCSRSIYGSRFTSG